MSNKAFIAIVAACYAWIFSLMGMSIYIYGLEDAFQGICGASVILIVTTIGAAGGFYFESR